MTNAAPETSKSPRHRARLTDEWWMIHRHFAAQTDGNMLKSVCERRLPKLYWTDPGIVRAVRGDRGSVSSETAGALVEGWVFTLLRTYMAAREFADGIHYWSPADARDTEVDFLLSRGTLHLAIEVKAANRVDHRHLKGLRAIAPLAGLSRRVLVYRGDRPQRTDDGIDILPAAQFADLLASGQLWP